MKTALKNLAMAAILALSVLGIALANAMAEDYVYSDKYVYKEYVVKKGDTLWEISKAHIEDAFMWPLIWRENLRINNPDLIYPGQKILIPVRMITTEVIEPETEAEAEMPVQMARSDVKPLKPIPEPYIIEEGKKTADETKPKSLMHIREVKHEDLAPMKAEPIVSREFLLRAGYISKLLPDAGKVNGSPTGRMAFGNHDSLYIDLKKKAKKGDKFYVVRKETDVIHPVTEEPMGSLMYVVGTIETLEPGKTRVRSIVRENFDLIQNDDYLDYYYEVDLPFVKGKPRTPNMEGQIVATNYMRNVLGKFDFVFIDKGSDHGLKEGDVLMTLVIGTDDKMNAIFQLVSLREKTSMGLLIRSEIDVYRGDVFQGVRYDFK